MGKGTATGVEPSNLFAGTDSSSILSDTASDSYSPTMVLEGGITYDDSDATGGNWFGNLKNLPLGQIGSVLGRLGNAGLTGASTYGAQSQPDYIPVYRYLGNGLAATSVLDNTKNKRNKVDQSYGFGDLINSYLGRSPWSLFSGGNQKSDDSQFLDWLHEKQNQYGVEQ